MPTERRHILFERDELFTALANQLERTDERTKFGTIVDLKIVEDPVVTVHLVVEMSSDGRTSAKPLKPEFVAAALLRFCKYQRIPLPKFGTKALRVINGQLALIVTLHRKPRSKDVSPAA